MVATVTEPTDLLLEWEENDGRVRPRLLNIERIGRTLRDIDLEREAPDGHSHWTAENAAELSDSLDWGCPFGDPGCDVDLLCDKCVEAAERCCGDCKHWEKVIGLVHTLPGGGYVPKGACRDHDLTLQAIHELNNALAAYDAAKADEATQAGGYRVVVKPAGTARNRISATLIHDGVTVRMLGSAMEVHALTDHGAIAKLSQDIVLFMHGPDRQAALHAVLLALAEMEKPQGTKEEGALDG